MGVLMEIVESIGLDSKEARKKIDTPELMSSFVRKRNRVDAINVSSVPAFLINDTYLVSGSNSVDYFIDLINRKFINVVA